MMRRYLPAPKQRKETNMSNLEGPGNAAIIADLHQQIVNHARTSLGLAIEIGGLLEEEKKRVPRGQFGSWIKIHLPNLTHRTANNYMRLNRERDQIKLENVSNLAEAYNLLTGGASMDRYEAEQASARILHHLHGLAETVIPFIEKLRAIRDEEAFAPDYPSFDAYLLSLEVAQEEFAVSDELYDPLRAWTSGGSAEAVLNVILAAAA